MKKVWCLNGPNLNRLDLRDHKYYGSLDFPQLSQLIEKVGQENGMEIEVRQTNSESEMIEWLQAAAVANLPVLLNPAAFTHYSYAIRDAAELLQAPLIEIHLSNPMSREEFRHTSVISGVAKGTIAGFGPDSYRLAIIALASLL